MKRYALLLLLGLVTLVLLPGCAELVAAGPGENGTIEIVMDDYSFTPDVIRLEAGQTVTIRLRNEGEKMHEFMAGRNVQVHENLTEGFGEGFFAGVDLDIQGPGMVMGLEEEGGETAMEMDMDVGAEEAGDHDEAGDEHDEEMEMGGMGTEAEDAMEEMPDEHDEEMEMGEGEHQEDEAEASDHEEEGEEHEEEMEMGGMGTEPEDAMEEMADEHGEEMEMGEDEHQEGEAEAGEHDEAEGIVAGRFGAVQMPLMDAHAGVMVMIDPEMIAAGEVTTITFTVPEGKTGRWEIGCFQELGQHYDDGMNGVIIVEP